MTPIETNTTMKKIILTCEHGGAKIPAPYKKLFTGRTSILKTHRALDIGALAIAREMQKNLRTSLDECEISRLIIDANRPISSSQLFSEFTSPLKDSAKQKLIRLYHEPHWRKIISRVAQLISKKHQVFHIAVHSMTDLLHGKTRPMQLALLYDSKNKNETKFAQTWIKELQLEFRKDYPRFKISSNKPYRGSDEGLTTHLRGLHNSKNYLGIELEINQKLLKSFKTLKQRQSFSRALSDSLTRAISKT